MTVLFADLVGFTSRAESLDPEEVRDVLHPYHARLRTELERFGGTVEKFIGDAVMAVFGAPVAHEDDPERAVRAALSIRDALSQASDSRVRIGITTGEALVSLDARAAEGEGIVAGDVVNTAARLQAAAPVDGILVDETTRRATERAIVFRESDAVHAKGKREPVVVWEAVEPRARFGVDWEQDGPAALVGRERELDALLGAYERSRSELAPQLVTVVGVPGIGKSRLVWELAQALDARPEDVFWRQGRSGFIGLSGDNSKLYEDVSTYADEGVVAILAAGLLFVLPLDWGKRRFTLNWNEATQIDWGTVILFGAGITLGTLMDDTGLAKVIGDSLADALGVSSLISITILAVVIAVLISETTSNTASAAIVVPIVISLAASVDVNPTIPALAAIFGANYGFMLPVSTPPNAIVYASGMIPITKMLRTGVVFDIVGAILCILGVVVMAKLVGLA